MAAALTERDKIKNPERLAHKLWPSDSVTPLLLARDDYGNPVPLTRAVSSVGDTTSSGWVADIATIGLADFLLTMGPASAGSGLLSRALTLTFDQYNALGVPSLLPAAGNTSFVGQKAPIPVRQ